MSASDSVTILMAALASLSEFLNRMANTLAIEDQKSMLTDATMAPPLTRMSKLTITLLGDSTVMDTIIEAIGLLVDLCL